MAIVWNEENAAHLLRRAGFGASPKEVAAAAKAGLAKTVAGLFKVDKRPDKLPADVDKSDSLNQLQAWWLERMRITKSPLVERMTLFWHNHFATGHAKIGSVDLMHAQNRTLRALGFGKFRDLVLAMSKDPAMIYWLDNNTNTKKKPNENYARELMELFTTGVLDRNGNPNYSENDVREGARAFTGWTVDDGEFFFAEWDHDFGSKTFRGVTGNLDGGHIVANLVLDPATSRRIPQLLWSYFAYEVDLNDPVLDELAAIYLANDTAIRPVVERIFNRDEFYSSAAKMALIKEPSVFVISALRSIGAKLVRKNDDDGNLGNRMTDLGQTLFNPPSVFGWDYGLAWVETTGTLERANVGQWIASRREKDEPIQINPKSVLGPAPNKLTPEQLATRVLANCGIAPPAASTVAALANYLRAEDNGAPGAFELDKETIDKKVRGMLALIFSSAEFQRQ